jgi:death-on-curing protein
VNSGVQPWRHLTTRATLVSHASAVFGVTGGGTNFTPSELECIDGKLGSAWTAELYVDDENKMEGIIFAAHLMFNLIKGHCLVDGNKRIAWVALVESLASLGWRIEVGHDDAEAFCLRLCENEESSAESVQEWLMEEGRLVPWRVSN